MINKTQEVTRSIILFFLAGLCEIGGGYLVWLWLREDFSWVLGAVGGFVLFLYGIVPTFQKTHFHRVYAAYGGVFIVMAVLWGWCSWWFCIIFVWHSSNVSENSLS